MALPLKLKSRIGNTDREGKSLSVPSMLLSDSAGRLVSGK